MAFCSFEVSDAFFLFLDAVGECFDGGAEMCDLGDEPFESGAALPAGHLECVEDHLRFHVRRNTPAKFA